MVRVEIDESKTLLKLAFEGRVAAADSHRALEEIVSLLDEVKPGFRLLTDLSHLEEMDLGFEAAIDRVMDLCNRKGISMVVRVIPDPQKDIGLNIMSLFHYGRGVRIVTCETMAEAMRALGN